MRRPTPIVLFLIVAVLFCLPLFTGLSRVDLRGDEAAHSYAVERILETGDWLIPRNSPTDDPFVEKPPLKFWIVAAGITSGLLPRDEFGMRFWDPLFAAFAFLYVFAIGRRLAGPVCGMAAVFILFVHGDLIFEHGLRSNDMEAALLLSYCGGVYHYFGWTVADSRRARWRHVLAVALYFALGFMVKFVAALFLPIVLGATTLLVRRRRAQLAADWRIWSAGGLLAAALIVPWFLYAQSLLGGDFWHIIFGSQVYDRLTVGLDPDHLRRWNFYFTELGSNLTRSGTFFLAAAGGVLLLTDTIRRRWAEGLTIVLWFALPLTVISFPTSKLYHYVYPFLPAVALAGGYLIAAIWLRLQPLVSRSVRLTYAVPWPALRTVLFGVAVAAGVIVVWTIIFGPLRIAIGDTQLLKTSSILRGLIVALVCAVLAGRASDASRVVVPVLILWMLPFPGYRDTLAHMRVQNHPLRSMRACIMAVRSTVPWHGLYVAGPDSAFGHGHFFYFRTLVPRERALIPSAQTISKYLVDPAQQSPVLIDALWYQTRDWPEWQPPVKAVQSDDALLLLPGEYSRCAPPSTP